NTLNEALPKRSGAKPAQALRELCEVTDEEWRPAIEVAFTRKFAVVVDDADYDIAEKVYHQLKDEAKGESLVNPMDVKALQTSAREGSLAKKLETSHPIARALVDHLFGSLMCVHKASDLRKHA